MFKKKHTVDFNNLPKHIGIIMDGNGRWAKKRKLPRKAGHSVGAKTFKSIARYCNKIGIEYLTVYAFSTENWKRPKDEVDAIMKLLKDYLVDAKNFKDENIKVKFIGDLAPLSDELKKLIVDAEEGSADATGLNLNIALNYGGRDEIVHAVKGVVEDVENGKLKKEDICESSISDRIYTANQPDPDIIIRPSGEYRLSNFMIWQAAYSEFWYSDVLWPDFSSKDLDKAICDFQNRNRRFGGV